MPSEEIKVDSNMNKTVIWSPQPKQYQFLERPEYEALYGGAAGGGKSDALLAEGLRQVHIPHYRAILFRKTYKELSELMDRSGEIYQPSFPKAKFNDSKHFWIFPSGAKIYFGGMQYEKDKKNYQGKRYDFIGFDEVTHFSWGEYSYLYSRNRPSAPGTRVYRRAATNPGGVGHGWCKDYFITPAPPLTPITRWYDITDPDGNHIKMKRKRIFVPSTVFDNKILLSNDPNYLANLAMLPEAERNALLYGDWDSFDGQVFREWKNDPGGVPSRYLTQQFTHVISPFKIPVDWKIIRGFDFGYSKPFSVAWYAVDHEGCIYRIRELYGCTGTPNVGVQWEPTKMAEKIREIENDDPNIKGRQIRGIADPSIFDESRGESIAAMMMRKGVYWSPGDNTRIPGKMQFHYRFAFDDRGRAMFYVFDTCKHFIRTIPTLVYSETDVEDIDTKQEDHIYDECRYVLMDHPINPRRNVLDKWKPADDPLNMMQQPQQINFYRL